MTEIKGQFSNVKFEDYDVDEFNEEVVKYNVTSVPTIIIEKNGEIVERFTGLSSKIAYVNAINEAIK
jgi:thioredoxin 1